MGTPPFHSRSPQAVINLQKLNEVTHLVIDEVQDRKGKVLLGSWGGGRNGKGHNSTPIGPGSEGTALAEISKALRLQSDVLEGKEPGVRERSGSLRSDRGRDSERDRERDRERERRHRERKSERDKEGLEKDKQRRHSQPSPVRQQSIFIAVKQVGSGRVVRIVSDRAALDRLYTQGLNSNKKVNSTPLLSLHCTALHCTACANTLLPLHCMCDRLTVLRCPTLQYTTLHCMYDQLSSPCTALHCTALHVCYCVRRIVYSCCLLYHYISHNLVIIAVCTEFLTLSSSLYLFIPLFIAHTIPGLYV